MIRVFLKAGRCVLSVSQKRRLRSEMFSGGAPVELDISELGGIFEALGIKSGELPENMAEINNILNALPPPVADRLMRFFYNEVSL